MNDSRSQQAGDDERWQRLTERQRACLDLILERKSSKQIARHLGISKDTVDQRIAAARRILGAGDRNEAALQYARLKSIYDRAVYDPALLAPPPRLVPSNFPDGDTASIVALNDCSLQAEGSASPPVPFREIWRYDHGLSRRMAILAMMLIATAILVLAGLAIGQALTRLISG